MWYMEIIGHQKIRDRLQRLTVMDSHPQSFLFVGPESIGKRLVAFEFAWTVLGRQADFLERSDETLSHPDIMFLEPERVTEKGKTREKKISIESIRDGLHFLSRYPLSGKYRVMIINDAHQLSHGAQNTLLKTLEEPNATSLLILVTHEASSLLETVHSRLQRVAFSLVPEESMRFLDVSSRDDGFWVPFGRPGLIVHASRDESLFANRRLLMERLLRMHVLSYTERLVLSEELSKDVPQALRLFEWYTAIVRNQAHKSSEGETLLRAYRFLGALQETRRTLQRTQANARLQFDTLFLKY